MKMMNDELVQKSLSNLVLSQRTIDQIGPAVNSGRSLFMSGPPGNGKTTIAEGIGHMVLGQEMYVPYAVEVDGQIIKVFDEINHEIVDDPAALRIGTIGAGYRDGRWQRIKRPVIMVAVRRFKEHHVGVMKGLEVAKNRHTARAEVSRKDDALRLPARQPRGETVLDRRPGAVASTAPRHPEVRPRDGGLLPAHGGARGAVVVAVGAHHRAVRHNVV